MNTEVTEVQKQADRYILSRFCHYLTAVNWMLLKSVFSQPPPPYLNRCKQKDRSKEEQWPERKAVNACANEGKALLARGKKQAQKQVTAQKPVQTQTSTNTTVQEQPPAQIPSEPPTAVIREIEVTQNVFQSNQPGLQIRLNFNIKNRKGIQVRAVAYFFDKNHQPLQDVNQRFKTADGKVSDRFNLPPRF